ncbi:MAG: hypothetical protein JW940_34180 [Polyangiaceae bacterium]|nr:hypothetical protein [Polyangiaceae bacterium]
MNEANRRWWLGSLLLALVLVTSRGAWAQSKAEIQSARRSYERALQEFDVGHYAEALRLYQAADEIMHLPTTGLGVAKALEQLGQLIEAQNKAREVSGLGPAPQERSQQAEARQRAQLLAEQLEQRIPTLLVSFPGVGPETQVQVTLDQEALPPSAGPVTRRVNPGTHTISATADGYEPAQVEREVPESRQTEVEIALRSVELPNEPPVATEAPAPAPVPAPPMRDAEPRRPIPLLAYVGFGAGAAGVVVGSVTGIWSWAKTSSLRDEYCHGGDVCDRGYTSERSSALTLARVSDVAFGVGVLGAAVGVYALVSDPSGSAPAQGQAPELRWNVGQQVSVRPELGARGMGLIGRF